MTSEEVPHRYVLGTKPRISSQAVSTEGILFIPTETRVSVKRPDRAIFTISGGDMIAGSGYLYFYYDADIVGWYQYESWVRDGNGLEDVDTKGFEIYDEVHAD